MITPRTREPTDLGQLATVDPSALEPGMIVWDRFCVIGTVRHSSPRWSVPATDLAREFGRTPHHRIALHYLPATGARRERIRRAVAADEQVQPRVRATVDLPRGVVLIHEPVEGEHLGAQLPAREARSLARALASLLLRLADAEVHGIDLRTNHLRQSEGQFRLAGFDHLDASGSETRDLSDLLALLRRLAEPHLTSLLTPPPASLSELHARARALDQRPGAPATLLSQHPPFVGRERAQRDLETRFAEAQIARSSMTLVCGGQGVGKSRLLEEFASWLRADARALVLRGEYLRGCGDSRGGLMGALGRLPAVLSASAPQLAEQVGERLRRRTGDQSDVLAGYAPALGELLAAPTGREPAVDFEDGFAGHAAVIAEGVRSIGSQGRPLVILLDNLQLADRGSTAVLRRLLLDDRSHHTMIVASLLGPVPPGLADTPDEGHWNPQRDPQLLLRRIALDRLGVAELERMIVAGLPGRVLRPQELAEALYEASSGNPLVAWATLQSWIDRGVLVRDDQQPWVLRRRKVAGTSPEQVFAERVERAGLDERWLALLAALAGGHVDEAWFQRVAGWETRRVATAVAGLERRGLMGQAGEASLRFPHELVRELVIAHTPASDVRRAHAAIASWLASLGPRVSAARLAFHTDRALGQAQFDPRLAEMHLAAGREMLGVYDLERSGWHFTRALIERGPGDGRLAAIEGAADVALLGGKHEEAAQLYAEAVAEAQDPRVVSRIAAKAIHGLFRKAAVDEAAILGRLALARADRPLPRTGLGRALARARARLSLPMPAPAEAVPETSDDELDEQLCWLYGRVSRALQLREPAAARLCLLRGLHRARGRASPAAAHLLALWAATRASRGDAAGERALVAAEALAERAESPWARGFVQLLRAQLIELPTGTYSEGLAQLSAAADCFRRAGDLSAAAASHLFKVVYGRDREALPVLHGWLDEAAALGQSQAEGTTELTIDALRLLLRARAGARNLPELSAGLAQRLDARQPASFEDYLAHAYLIFALLEAGCVAEARVRLELAPTPASRVADLPEFALELWVARALVRAGDCRSRTDRRDLAKALRVLERAGRRWPRIAALARLARLRHAAAASRRSAVRSAAAAVIAGLSEHGQRLLVLEAHRSLGELLRGSEVLAAGEHLRIAAQLSDELGLVEARQRERERDEHDEDAVQLRPRERSSRRHSQAYLRALTRSELVAVREVLEGSRAVLIETLGDVPWIYLRATPELRVHGELLELQSLLVHLALCARDSVTEPRQLRAIGSLELVDETQAAAIPGAAVGQWGRIAVSAIGTQTLDAGVTGGVSACRQVATRLGGFLSVESAGGSLTLAVYLPAERVRSIASAAPPEGQRSVFVIHPEPRVRETLASAVSRLGHRCDSAAPPGPSDPPLPDAELWFIDSDTLGRPSLTLPASTDTVIEIASRGAAVGGQLPILRVPFALAELRRILEGSAPGSTPPPRSS